MERTIRVKGKGSILVKPDTNAFFDWFKIQELSR